MAETLVFALPEVADPAHPEAHWWLLGEGAIVEAGVGADWPSLASDARVRAPMRPATLS